MDIIQKRIHLPYSFASLKGEAKEEYIELVNELGEKIPLVERQAIVQQRLIAREIIEREKLSLSLKLNIKRPAVSKTSIQIASLVGAPIDGSALIISPQILLTSFKALPQAELAKNAIAKIRFEYVSSLLSVAEPLEYEYLLEPNLLFIPCEELDFTLVALIPAKTSPKISEQDVTQLDESEEALARTIRGALPKESDFINELVNYMPILSSSNYFSAYGIPQGSRFSVEESYKLSSLLSEAARNRTIIDWIRNKYHSLDSKKQDLLQEFFKVQSITPLQVRTTKKFKFPPITLSSIASIQSYIPYYPQSQMVGLKIDLFSGRKNPECKIDLTTATDILEKLDLLLQKTSLEPSEFAFLGYRGFWITFPRNQTYYVPARLMRSSIPQERELQKILIAVHRQALEKVVSATNVIPPDAITDTLNSVDIELKTADIKKKRGNCPSCMASDAPQFDPTGFAENCYAYALNRVDFIELEAETNNGLLSFDCENASEAARSNGLRDSPNFSRTLGPQEGWYVALCLSADGFDYHWFRQDKHGCWSHMPPGNYSFAQDKDYSGINISDPETCDRGDYSTFCRFMITPNSQVN